MTAQSHPLRVLDCADLSGAFCGVALARLGARVDYLPAVPGGVIVDDERITEFYGPPHGRRPCGSPVPPLGGAALENVDIVVTSGRPSELASAGIEFAEILSRYPHLVVVNFSPFGLTGRRAEWRGGNLIAAASGGMLAVNGWPDEPPLQPLGLQAYHVAGVLGAIGALLALRVRDAGGSGQLVDVSLQESCVAALEHVTAMYRERGTIARRSGTLHWTRTFRSVPAADGEVLASHLGDWDALREWIAAESGGDDIRDDRWRDAAYRREHCHDLFDRIARWSVRYRMDDLVEQAQSRRLPFAPIQPLTRATQLVPSPPAPNSPLKNSTACFDELSMSGSPPRFQRTFPLALSLSKGRLGVFQRAANPQPLTPSSPLRNRTRAASRQPSPLAPHPSPLSKVLVIDLTWVVAGPVATRVLADFGADVIKIEHPQTATDTARRGGWFGNLNRGKRSVVLDLRTPRGIDELRRLIAAGDVLVENFSPRVLANWGLDEAALRALNPRLTVVHMSGFGRGGPLRDWVSYGPTLQALLGFTAHMRHPGGRPAGWGYSYSDMISGYTAALAVVAALRAGGGRHIDLSQMEVLAGVIGPDLAAASHGVDRGALGNASQEGAVAPHGVYCCADGGVDGGDRWCAIAVFDDQQWRALAAEIDARLLAEDRYATAAGRHRHAAVLDRIVGDWTRPRLAEDVAERLQSAGVAAALVADAHDLLYQDEHLRERGMWSEVTTTSGERVELDAPRPCLSASPGVIRAAGPLLGEHAQSVESLLRELRAAADCAGCTPLPGGRATPGRRAE